jgi:hypothetical protein
MCEWNDVVKMPIRGRVCDIDRCVHHIVAALNAGGVATEACCCGHGKRIGSIILADGRYLLIFPDRESWEIAEKKL